jgi:hypothetical protein
MSSSLYTPLAGVRQQYLVKRILHLAKELDRPELVHVFVLADGLQVNGSELIAGLAKRLPAHVAITGGLAGAGVRSQETLVFWDGAPEQEVIAALGLYSDRLRVGYGALGGWDSPPSDQSA